MSEMIDRYNIFIQGELEYDSITEEEMFDVTQDLADKFYSEGTPHPDDVVVEYLGNELD
tara:strand:- start:21746 stop:21922 length:177 start_codon:yes stop_codon:yes gene_type:complete